MLNLKKVIREIETARSLKTLTQAYEEISVMKMQAIRGSVLSTRDFTDRLSSVFTDVRASYRAQILKLAAQKKIKDLEQFSTFAKNGKTVSVLLSANTKLYGDIIVRVFRLFWASVRTDGSDIIVIGKLGKELVDQRADKKPYLYFEIPDTNLPADDLKPIVYQLANYEIVKVYFGRFANMVHQDPAMAIISGQPEKTASADEPTKDYFLFEPKLEAVLRFFETQLFAGFFKQTVSEGQLARFASRITAMESALQNIDNRIKNLSEQRCRIRKMAEGKKQGERIAGLSLWTN